MLLHPKGTVPMKGSVILSIALDILAVITILLPVRWFTWLSSNTRVVTNLKRACSVLLLLAGYLVDKYISHPG
jgi:hypothetical protein